MLVCMNVIKANQLTGFYMRATLAFNGLIKNLSFEKWRTIRTSVGGVGGVLVWVAC